MALLSCLFVALAAVFVTSLLPEVTGHSNVDSEWQNFKKTYAKSYASPGEEAERRRIFESKLAEIATHNEEYRKGMHGYEQGLNAHSDKSCDEMDATMKGIRVDEGRNSSSDTPTIFSLPLIGCPNIIDVTVPTSMDWRKKGAVTGVKDQGSCGSCYAFNSNGAMEGAYQIRHGKLISLSEQNIVDCSRGYGNNGCNGGFMDHVFDYVKDNSGVDTEKSYPYKAKEEQCQYKQENAAGVKVIGYERTPKGDEKALQRAVAKRGPVAVAIDTHGGGFNNYKSGVYYSSSCTNKVDHGVLIVGYGSENGKDYWIVKNSWGTSWGEKGYIRMARNRNSNCAIADWPYYPLIQ